MPVPPETEVLAPYRMTYNFYQEVRHREAHSRYCRWYHETAAETRREFMAMQNDLNLLRLFRRRSR